VGGLGTTSGNEPIPNLPAGSVAIGVVIEPLLAWLWAGGLLIGVGGTLALIPGTRRRATDPVSVPSAMVTGTGPDAPHEDSDMDPSEHSPVGVSVPVESGAPSA
jgi:hypothetical protein